MPYHVGAKGSYGCNGYPALKDDGTVMGCHKTKEDAMSQIYAINVSENNVEGKSLSDSNGMPSATGQPYPASQGEFVSPIPKKKTSDTSMSDEIDEQQEDKALFADFG
jgi:hypothetical protein